MTIPVSRWRALGRAIVWVVPTTLATVVSVLVYPNLDYRAPSGVNRLVAYSIALVVLPVSVAAVACGYACVRCILLAVWPARVCIRADARGLLLRLGPFGTRRYRSDRLVVSYPFEQDADETDGGFEAYLPEEEQQARFLPRLTHPEAPEPIQRTLLRFGAGDESAIASRMRSIIQLWRARDASSSIKEGMIRDG